MSQTTLATQSTDEPVATNDGFHRNRIVLSLVLMLLAVIACKDAWLDILRIVQKDEEASHIMLVPLVFARIAWVRRSELKGIALGASLWGPVIALVGVCFWFFGNIKAMQIFWHFGAIFAVFGAFVCVNGLSVVRRLWPAFLVLLFLMPMPGTIRQPLALFLQNISAQATEIVIVALGFELVRHGNLLIINDYPVGIAEACNGMRMVSMLILVVFAFVFSEKVRLWVRVALVLLAAPMAILLNIVRLVPTVLAYGYFSPDFADQLHDWLGWVMVIASYFVLMGMLALMRWLLLPVEPDGRSRSSWLPRRKPVRRKDRDRKPMGAGTRLAIASVAVCVVLGASLGLGLSLPDGSEAEAYHAKVREVAEALPRQVGPWSAVDIELPEAAVALLRPNVLISRRYVDEEGDRSFAMLVVQCADARDMEGHYPPNCYPSSGWTSLSQEPMRIGLGGEVVNSIEYEFERASIDSFERIGVVNLILVPGNGYVTSMRRIRQLAGTVSDRYFGAAQVQFVFSGNWELDERQAAVEEVIQTFEPLLGVILDKTGK